MKIIKLADNTINKDDIGHLIKWLSKTPIPQLTMGKLTLEFESKWSNIFGMKHSIFVNSGSSAILLMLYSLLIGGFLKNKKIVVPTLSWSTDLSPVIQLGLKPILVDCNLGDLSVNYFDLEKIFKKEKPDVLLLVSVLGLVPEMNKITELCKKYNVILLEDICESTGSEYNGKKLGSFGLMSANSLYYGHAFSTIEGGMICTDDDKLSDILRMIRSHGWDRNISKDKSKRLRKKWNVNDFDGFYTFYLPSFNVRSSDLNAFIGLRQIERFDKVVNKRYEKYLLYNKYLKNDYWKPEFLEKTKICNLGYPIIHPKRNQIIKALKNLVELRPLISGSMGTQPFYVERYNKIDFPNSKIIDNYGLYLPNNTYIKKKEIKFICNIINNIINVS